MRPKVALLARVKVGKRYLFEAVKIKNGKPVEPDEPTSYYLKYSQNGKQRVEAVGADLSRAFVAFQNRELNQARTRMGLSAITELGPARDTSGRMKIAHAVAVYLQDLTDATKTGERAGTTQRGYKRAVEAFRDQCGVQFMEDITADVLRRHKLYLFETIKKKRHGSKHNTVATRFRYLNTFFNKFGIKMVRDRSPQKTDTGLLNYGDVPREQKKPNTDKYSTEEIKAMLAVADVDEADLIHFFLRTGVRDGECSFMEWKDIDFRRQQVMVREKPGIWKPKDKENRDIPVEDGVLLKRLEERRERQKPKSHLIFPNALGHPDKHLIRQLHKIVGKIKEKGGEIEGVPTLHRFRRTYASMMISHSDLQTVSDLLGHADLQTTSLYLAPDKPKARVGTRTAFREVD
ncbi:MAG: site-specific integrase [Candidatus Acidiferrum sp.]